MVPLKAREAIHPQDLILIRQLRHFKPDGVHPVLCDVDGGRIQVQNGAVVVACPDCDQKPESDWYLHSTFGGPNNPPRFQFTPGHNGGPIALPINSPLNTEINHTEVAIKNIVDALDAKELDRTVLLIAHLPCGMAKKHRLSLYDILSLTMDAKDTIKRRIPDVRVPMMLDINYLGSTATKETGAIPNGKRTYYITRAGWYAFANSISA